MNARRLRILQMAAMVDAEQAQEDLLLAQWYMRRNRRQRRRRHWVKPWVQRRQQFGQYDTLMNELRAEDPEGFQNFMRLTPALYDEVLERIRPRITKEDTWWRKALDAGLKFAVTMRHLASGDSYSSLKWDFRAPGNTISVFVKEVCQAIIDEYAEEVIQCPTTAAEWRAVAEEFQRRWNFPHACGALDGKHVACKCPANTGSLYHNYKGFFSIIMMALADADYRFLWIDVGPDGASSEAQIYNDSELKEALDNQIISFPDPEPLPGDNRDMPFFFLGDLRPNLMKPFSIRGMTMEERIFNYRTQGYGKCIWFQVLLSTMTARSGYSEDYCPSLCMPPQPYEDPVPGPAAWSSGC